jgi:hypothetical protein
MKDETNQASPYLINIWHLERSELVDFVDPVAPLARVTVQSIPEAFLNHKEDDLSTQEKIYYKFLQQSYEGCIKMATDKKFVKYLQMVE